MTSSNPNYHHHKEGDYSSSSETEGSHTKGEGEDHSIEADAARLDSNKPAASRKAVLWCVGLALAIVIVVVVPAIEIVKHKNNNNNSKNAQSSKIVAASATLDTFEYKAEDNEQCPGHLTEGDFPEVSRMYFSNMVLGDRYWSVEDRTFDVEPSHTVSASGDAVEFNVETVNEALAEDLNKPILTKDQILIKVNTEAGQFYTNMTDRMFAPPPPNVTMEVTSTVDEPLVYAGSQGFLACCMMAFAQHLPLALSADHLWTVIAQGFAQHVNQHAEELRAKFVAHEGKKEIRVREDSMVQGESSAEMWEELIFPKISEAIELKMNNSEAYETLAGRFFSTTTPTAQAASEIVLMTAMSQYFEYTMVTACGIPRIRLEGTRDDWVALRDRAQKLGLWMMPGHTHGELWIQGIVVPILNEFIDAYDGKINYCFWQTMVKFRASGNGSGSFDFLSGWLPTLFPYLNKEGTIEPNPFLRSWQESASALHQGPAPKDIPGQLSSVPVKWEYFQVEFPLHFHAGFRGVTQEEDGTLAPVLGWFVTNDPEADS